MSIPIRNADPLNVIASDRTFFITSSTWEKRGLLQSARSATLFIDVLHHYREQRKYLLHEFVVMPDHFHLLLTVDTEMTVEKAVQLIKAVSRFGPVANLDSAHPFGRRGFPNYG